MVISRVHHEISSSWPLQPFRQLMYSRDSSGRRNTFRFYKCAKMWHAPSLSLCIAVTAPLRPVPTHRTWVLFISGKLPNGSFGQNVDQFCSFFRLFPHFCVGWLTVSSKCNFIWSRWTRRNWRWRGERPSPGSSKNCHSCFVLALILFVILFTVAAGIFAPVLYQIRQLAIE